MPFQKPSFDSLPLDKTGPHGNAWGLFGKDDQLGMLNLLTPDVVKAAASEIVDGTRVSTDLSLDAIARPFFNRAEIEHTIKTKTPRAVNDDTVCFNTQVSSQWDGFRHYGYQKERLWFGGRQLEEMLAGKDLGIQTWVEHGGIAGRGVLLDYAGWAKSHGRKIDRFSSTNITASDLRLVAEAQGTSFQPGDILFIRTGWVHDFQLLDQDTQAQLASVSSPPSIGIESSEATLRWLWEQDFAAVAGDQPAMEAWPCQNEAFWLHEWLLAGWGMPIGELFDLEKLASVCESKNRWSFFFSSVPLKVPGGVASPPNGVAIF